MFTYAETRKYLDSLINYEKTGFTSCEKDFDLAKIREALEILGQDEQGYRSVHIAGTKGKGSISMFTSSILQANGFNVGLFTSPHLICDRERIRVNNEIISEGDLSRALSYLQDKLGDSFCQDLTYFEIYTLMAVFYFSMKKVDFAVFETGMGGRLDATNVIDAEVCGISPISYDHMSVLGDKIEQIASEKAAIIKRGACCISSHQEDSVLGVIKQRCHDVDAPLSLVGRDITYSVSHTGEEGNAFDVNGLEASYQVCSTRMLGSFQASNCAAAIGICEKLLGGKGVDTAKVKEGIKNAFIPGRMEILSRKPLMLIDGAQNADSADKLKKSVEQIFKYDKLILLLGLSEGKDIKGVCDELASFADEIILTRASVKRAQDPHIIRGYIRKRPVRVTKDVKEALGVALDLAGENDMILATGSFFLIGEVRRLLLRKR